MINDAVLLAYRMNLGESLRYRTEVQSVQKIKETGKATQQSQSVLEMTMLQTAKEVAPDGTTTVDVTIEKGTIKREGQVLPLPSAGSTIQIVMKRSGEIVRTSVDFPFNQPAFPEHPIKLKETWNSDSKMDIPLYDDDGNQTGVKEVILKYGYTLAGFEHVLGYETGQIVVSCPTTQVTLSEGVEQKITARGQTNFAHQQGRLVRSKVETETEITAPGTSVETSIKVTVELTEVIAGKDGGETPGASDELFIIR
jgi:hypothetical protein